MPEGGFFFQPLLDLLFPSVCVVCGKPAAGSLCLCDSCLAGVRYPGFPLCVRCGTPFKTDNGGDHLCGSCLRNPPPFACARAVALYESPVDTLLHRLKFSADRTVLSTLAALAAPVDLSAFSSCDLIIPVPLHRRRLQKRGLNQSLVLAQTLFPDTVKAIRSDILVRTRSTPPQTSLGRRERKENLKGAFAMTSDACIDGMSICLVDDILTTGTTVTECADTLMRAGAGEIRILAMARVSGKNAL